jgi:hypothetical protein
MPLIFMKKTISFLLIAAFIVFSGCGKNKNLDQNRPLGAEDKRKRNIEEGRGVSMGSIFGNRGSTNYEFSTSNPMWRSSLETLDFLPLTTVDYSGGVIITDWYSDNGQQDAVKITIRFLSNEIRSDSIKVIVHKKNCDKNLNCKTSVSSSSLIKDELKSTILRKAALLEKTDKEKK